MRRWLLIAGGVVAAHLLLFAAVMNVKPVPKRPYRPPPTPANFGSATVVHRDAFTGERTVERQFQVSTKLADPAETPSDPAP